MIIQLAKNISGDRLDKIREQVSRIGFDSNLVKTQYGEYLVGIGSSDIDLRAIGSMEGIVDIHRVSEHFKLVSSKWKTSKSCIDLGDGVKIGNDNFGLMAGP